MTSNITCYWGSGGAPSWRVLLCLAEKELDAKLHCLSLGKKEHKSDLILSLNPRGQVPTFVDGDALVHESLAAIIYLELQYPNKGIQLLPANAALMALVLQRVHEVNNLYSKCMDIVLYHWKRKPHYTQDVLVEKNKQFVEELLLWEGYCDDYLVSKTFTLADVSFFPVIAFLERLGLNFDEFPALHAYYNHLVKRPSILSTWPPHWKTDKPRLVLADIGK